MIRKSALAASIAALLTPALASALGLGNIEVTSALNEPLQARIPLRGADPGQLEELRVALADDQQFERAGLDRVYVLTKLKFQVVEAGSGSGFISISTRDPVAEPFLNFLVDVNWARGRVLREYTVLLDPPVYGAAISTGTQRKVRTVETRPAPSVPAPVIASKSAAPAPASAPVTGAAAQGIPRYTGDSYGPVRQGETLWSIADRAQSDGTSIQSMMLAILRANPEAFSLDNVNSLRTGAVLRIPAASEVSGGKAAAIEEVARHHALWAEYRQSISGTVSPQPGGTPSAPVAESSTASESASAAQSGGSDDSTSSAELKLVGAGTAGAVTGGGAAVDALRNELTMAQEEADAATLENQELQSRLTEVESLVGDLQRLVELKEDQLAALQDQLAKASEQAAALPTPMQATEAKASEPEPKMAEAKTPEEPEKPKAVKKKRRAPPPPPAPPKSMMDDINDMLPVPLWTLLAGLGTVLLGFGGWRFARGRKEKAAAVSAGVPSVADGESMIEQYARTEMPGTGTAVDDDVTELPSTPSADDSTLVDETDEDRTDLAAAVTTQNTVTPPTDEEDPLAEVNVYLAYERFDQAEQLVRDAISTYPDRHDYKLKLLEVFYAAKNLDAFEVAAGDLKDAVGDDHDMMQQAREWWTDLGAGRELLSGDPGPSTHQGLSTGAVEDDDLFDVTASDDGASDGEETGVDFDLGFEPGDGTDVDGVSSLDFDLGGDDEASGEETGLDFDLGSLGEAAAVAGGAAVAGAAAAAASDSDLDLDFDLGAGDDDSASAVADGSVDFDLDAGAEAGDGTGLDFDLSADGDADEPLAPGDAPVSPDAVTAQASLPERAVAADGDTGLDFDLGGLDDDAAQAGSGEVDDAGGESLDFDLSDTAGTVDGGAQDVGALHDAAGEESGLDFDLGDTRTVDAAAAGGSVETAGSVDSELDFDLGEATSDALVDGDSVLDFDLGDTGPGIGAGDAESESSLDFDLGDTHQSVGAVGSPTLDGVGTAGDGELDIDLTDTLGVDRGGESSLDAGSELDFDLGDTASDVGSASAEDLGLDLDLGVGTQGGDDLDLSLDDTMGSGDLDLDLSLDAGEGAAGNDGLPVLDLDLDEAPAFDTVQLDPDAAASIRDDDGDGEAGTGSEFGVDTEFRGIFSSGDGDDESASGTESVLDFDLGSADLGATAEEFELPEISELESTQFMLRDVVADDEGQDDDDHTLVLGRGASGEVDEIQTKLDLAQAYMDMGDTEGARNLLGEVMADGDDPQKDQAGEMLKKLS